MTLPPPAPTGTGGMGDREGRPYAWPCRGGHRPPAPRPLRYKDRPRSDASGAVFHPRSSLARKVMDLGVAMSSNWTT